MKFNQAGNGENMHDRLNKLLKINLAHLVFMMTFYSIQIGQMKNQLNSDEREENPSKDYSYG